MGERERGKEIRPYLHHQGAGAISASLSLSAQTPAQQCTVPSSKWQVLQGRVSAHKSPAWQTSLNSQTALRSAAQPHVGPFPRICSQVPGGPADTWALCRSPGMFRYLQNSCHSHHVLVSLRNHAWGHEGFPHSPTAAEV